MNRKEITPELIPHSEFHSGSWLLSVKRPDWYYFMRKKNYNTINNEKFITTVDKPLRRLVRYLHKRGIKTTPSCSGHHIRERSLEKIYDSLENDAKDIRNTMLILKDVETDHYYFYSDESYSLPWTKEEFIDQVSVYQQKGVLGIRLGNRKKMRNALLNMKIEGARIEERDAIVFFFTDEDNQGDNRHLWKRITKATIRLLRTQLAEFPQINSTASEENINTDPVFLH
jgi:hypothetical protein